GGKLGYGDQHQPARPEIRGTWFNPVERAGREPVLRKPRFCQHHPRFVPDDVACTVVAAVSTVSQRVGSPGIGGPQSIQRTRRRVDETECPRLERARELYLQ